MIRDVLAVEEVQSLEELKIEQENGQTDETNGQKMIEKKGKMVRRIEKNMVRRIERKRQ